MEWPSDKYGILQHGILESAWCAKHVVCLTRGITTSMQSSDKNNIISNVIGQLCVTNAKEHLSNTDGDLNGEHVAGVCGCEAVPRSRNVEMTSNSKH
jgi:hypothetical protein